MSVTKRKPAPNKTNKERVFLLVVDETREMEAALYYACHRAIESGSQIALLSVVEPADFQHWMSVGELMREESHEEAKDKLSQMSKTVKQLTGKKPILYIREGEVKDALLDLIENEPSISILVLGAGNSQKGPGPLVSSLIGMSGKLRIPMTLIPENLTHQEIDDQV